MKAKRIEVLAAVRQDLLDSRGADVDQTFDTIGEAKRKAKYYLTEEFMRSCETTIRMGYSQVVVNGECLYDFFAR